MKRIVVLIMALMLIVSSCGTNRSNDDLSSDSGVSDFVEKIAKENAEELSEKYNGGYSIDEQYIEEYKTSKDMADMGNITAKYANLWLEKVNVYSKALSEHIKNIYDNDKVALEYAEFHNWNTEIFDTMQKDWEEYAEKQIKDYQEFVHLKYWSGTAAGTAVGVFKYDLYRARAIELYEYCSLWGVEAEKP